MSLKRKQRRVKYLWSVIDQIPNVAGLKHSAANQAMIPVFKNMGLACFSGNGFLPLPFINLGAVGTVDAPLSIIPAVLQCFASMWIVGILILLKSAKKLPRKLAY